MPSGRNLVGAISGPILIRSRPASLAPAALTLVLGSFNFADPTVGACFVDAVAQGGDDLNEWRPVRGSIRRLEQRGLSELPVRCQ